MRDRRLALALAACALAAACGHRIGGDELLAANGGTSDGPRSAGALVAAQVAEPGGPTTVGPATDVPSTGGAAPGTPSTTAPTNGSPTDGHAVPAGAAAAAGGCSTPGETAPIAVGSVGNYSGAAGSSLISNAKTMQSWAQWVNARGGICGRRVQVIVVDDHSDPAQYRAALQDLVENRHVIGFVNAATLTAEAGIEYLESVGVPEVGGTSSVERLWDSPIVFKVAPRPPMLYFGGARTAAQFGPPSKKVALITCREVEACGSAARAELVERDGAKQAGVQVVYSTEASVAQPDYTAECRGAQASGAEVVLLFLDAASVRRFGQSCNRQGYKPVYSQISSTVTNDTKDHPGLADLLVSTSAFAFTSNTTPAQKEFQRAMAEVHGAEPGPGESLAWASAKLLELGLTRAARTARSMTPATLVAALHTVRNETLDGLIAPVSYPPGRPGIYRPCWFAMKAAGGKWSALNGGAPVCRD